MSEKNLDPNIAQDLQSSEARNRAMIEFAYDAFIGMDTDGNITDWNRQAEKTFGWRYDEVLGHTLSDVIIPERYREAHKKGLARYLSSGVGPVLNKRITVTATHRSGREVPVELTIYPIKQGDGVIFGAFLHDITEQKRNTQIQETQLKVTEALTQFSTLPEVVPELLKRICVGMEWSAGEFWLLASEDFEKLDCIGTWASPDAENQEFVNGAEKNIIKKGQGLIGQVWESGQSIWIEDISLNKIFLRTQEAQQAGIKSALAFPLRTSGKVVGVMCFFISQVTVFDSRLLESVTDIGNYVGLFIERRHAEENLARLYQELERKVEERTRDLAAAYEQAKTANRLKDEFLATVSHELRTPLGVIIGFTDLLLDTPMSDEEKQTALETIRRSGKAQIQIINDLLDVSRIITGKMQLALGAVDMPSAIEGAIKSIEIAASAKNIEVTSDIDPSVGAVRGDSDRLQQILWNLLTNAVKFTPQKGKVRVSLKRNHSKAEIEVVDSGKGIESSFLPYVFDRFRQEDATTTRKYGGLGLGLAIVRSLVEAHGGTVEVSSEGLGHGSKFTVKLPLMAFQETVSEKPVSVSLPKTSFPLQTLKPLQDLKILVVEDEPDTRTMTGRILTNAGANVVLAASAKEGFQFFQQQRPDLLISDISMPEHDGYEFISMIRDLPASQGGNIRAVAFTAHVRQDEKNLMLDKGFNYQISKPIEAAELVSQLSDIIHS